MGGFATPEKGSVGQALGPLRSSQAAEEEDARIAHSHVSQHKVKVQGASTPLFRQNLPCCLLLLRGACLSPLPGTGRNFPPRCSGVGQVTGSGQSV